MAALAAVLNKMPKLESVVSEVLRMCIASITLRHVMEPFALKLGDQSVLLRGKDQVILAPTLTHYDASIYPNPTVFQWDRFLMPAGNNKEQGAREEEEDTNVSLSRAKPKPARYKNGVKVPASIALQPFGGGSTMCPGRHFALAEIKAFVALVLVKWDIDFGKEDDDNVELAFGKKGVPKLEQARAGLGSLPPLKGDKVKCRWRPRQF